MKRVLNLILFITIAALLLPLAVNAADGIFTKDYTTANENCSITYRNGKYTVTYSGEDLIAGGQYALCITEGTVDNYSISENSLMYIDQKPAANVNGKVTLSFINFIPKNIRNCVVLIGGKFSGTSETKRILGTIIETTGVEVSGTIASCNLDVYPELELYVAGTTTNPVASAKIVAASGIQEVSQSFVFKSVPHDTVYDLKIVKAGHAVYWLKGIPVGEIGLALGTLTLPCGDVNGDGNINASDLNQILSTETFNKAVSAAMPCADLNGDGLVNATDINIILSTANYNKGTVTVTYNK